MEWINIKDKPPEKDKEVLLQAKCNGQMYVGYRAYEDVYKCITARGSIVTGLKPVAWMELPDKYVEER